MKQIKIKIYIELVKEIEELRTKKHLTIKEISDYAKIEQMTYHNIINFKSMPATDTFLLLCKCVGLKTIEL